MEEPAADSGKLNFPDLSCSADLMNQIDFPDSVAAGQADPMSLTDLTGSAADPTGLTDLTGSEADPTGLTDLTGSVADPRDQTDLTDCP